MALQAIKVLEGMEEVKCIMNLSYRRWFVLTPTHLFSYKEYKKYEKPTEAIEVSSCKTVKSAEEEINRKFTFVNS